MSKWHQAASPCNRESDHYIPMRRVSKRLAMLISEKAGIANIGGMSASETQACDMCVAATDARK